MASAVLSIQAEIESSRLRLQQVLTRLELAERTADTRAATRNLDCSSNINEGPSEYCGDSREFIEDQDHDEVHDEDQDEDQEDSRCNDFQSLPADWQYSPRSPSPDQEVEQEPDPATIARHRHKHQKVVINVGGVKHEVMWAMLEKRPLTRLGLLAKAKTHDDILSLVDAYSLAHNEIYFDRDPITFNGILDFYRTERLHVLDEICILDYQDDLEFWMIKELNLEICCVDKFNARREHIHAELEKERHMQAVEEVLEDFGEGYFAPHQRALWDLFEKPQSSLAAKLISILSLLMVLASTVGMCLNTFEWIQAKDVNGDPVDNPYLALIEAVCISYFSVEFLLR